MERLQKVLAQAGIASRRAAEQIILAGRVRVDGRIVRELGTQVDPRKSRVEVDGTKIVAEKLVYIVLHKPRGVVCTLSDPEGRPTILELIKGAGARLVPVGRLDFHTSGALLCTNDGEFAQGLAHPKRAVPKVYVAKVKGTVDDDAMQRFGERIEIDGRPTQPAQVKRLRFEGDKTWLEITLSEGRNRQVRRLGEATGFPVMRLARISHAGIDSEDLRPGQWRELSLEELSALKRDYGVPKKVRAPSLDHSSRKEERGEGPSARYDKRTPRTAPKKTAPSSEVKGEHWSRETRRAERRPLSPRDERSAAPAARAGRFAGPPPRQVRGEAPRRESAGLGPRREAAPRGERREAAPRGERREAAPRGERRESAERGKNAGRGERREAPRDERRETAARGERGAAPAPRGKRSDGARTERAPTAEGRGRPKPSSAKPYAPASGRRRGTSR
jgi:23S rRNA pseudouridine2605 synthase